MFIRMLSTMVAGRLALPLSLAGALGVLTAASPLNDASPPETPPASIQAASQIAPRQPQSARDRDTEAAIRDILEFRQHQGSLLEGTTLEQLAGAPPGSTNSDWADVEFANALRQVAATAAQEETAETPDDNSVTGQPVAAQSPGSHTDAQLIEALRTASRLLDSKAHDLESLQHYRKADRLRALARRLRLEARKT